MKPVARMMVYQSMKRGHFLTWCFRVLISNSSLKKAHPNIYTFSSVVILNALVLVTLFALVPQPLAPLEQQMARSFRYALNQESWWVANYKAVFGKPKGLPRCRYLLL